MKEILEDGKIKLIPSDWRYSATIIGLYRFFIQLGFNEAFIINYDEFIYDPAYLFDSPNFEENFTKFLKQYYGEKEFHHTRLKSMLLSEHPENLIKEINETLKYNSAMTSIFGKIKYDGTNADKILGLIDKNDVFLTIKTFEFKYTMYRKYCQVSRSTSTLFETDLNCCRLNGYYFDYSKKSKSTGYNFTNQYFEDIQEFDFVVFGFSKAKSNEESIFINANYNINSLIAANDKIKEDEDLKHMLIKNLKLSSNFINNNIEVIIKNRKEFFESFILNQNSINIFKQIDDLNDISYIKIKDNYINLKKEIINAIVNNIYLDYLINLALKNKYNSLRLFKIIKINQIIYSKGENKMTDKFKSAYACAMEVTKSLNENKVKSFKAKLLSAITVDDKDNIYKILSKLSNFSEVNFSFIYDLLEDYDTNKNILYVFINTLGNLSKEDNKNE